MSSGFLKRLLLALLGILLVAIAAFAVTSRIWMTGIFVGHVSLLLHTGIREMTILV